MRLEIDIHGRVPPAFELASPDQFLPPLEDWRSGSRFITRHGQVEFYHYDFYAQASAKILSGQAIDMVDVSSYVRLGKVTRVY